MIELKSALERDLWIKYFEKYLNDKTENNGNGYSAFGAAGKADEIIKELQSRNKYSDDDY